MANEQAKRFYVNGRVQGVGFRFFVERTAEKLGLAGYVKNRRDGRVEVYAVGPGEKLAELRDHLQRGPRAARVEDVEEEETGIEDRYRKRFMVETEGGWL